jgi:hypothetical protein
LPAAALFFLAVYGLFILGWGYHQAPANYADHAYCAAQAGLDAAATKDSKPKARVEQQRCQSGHRDSRGGSEAEWESVHAVNRSNELAMAGIEFGRINALLALITSSFAVFGTWYAAKAADEAVKGNAATAETLRATHAATQPRLIPELVSLALSAVSGLPKIVVRNVGGGPAVDAQVRYTAQADPFIEWDLDAVPWQPVGGTVLVSAGDQVEVGALWSLSDRWFAFEVRYSDALGRSRRTLRVYETIAGSSYVSREVHEN